MEIFSLRVEKKTVGKKFPFDRVYLVKHADRTVIERMFRAALVMPVDETLGTMLLGVELDAVKNRPHNRGPEDEEEREPRANELKDMLESADWVMVVPIVQRWYRDNEERLRQLADGIEAGHEGPNYLVTPKWFGTHKKKRKERAEKPFFPTLTYLQVPGDKIRPVCVACPRMVAHQNGECQIGQKECYENLSLGLTNHYKQGMDYPDAPTNIKEMSDGDLHA